MFKYCDGTNWISVATPIAPVTGTSGSAGAPTYSFGAGTNTGMYSSGVGTIAFSTAGTQLMTLSNSGASIASNLSVTGGVSASGFYNNAVYIYNTRNNPATPAYSFNADGIDSGFYYPAADTLGFVTNGSEKMRIDAVGNVGIGTTAPDSAHRLHVRGSLGNGTFVLLDSSTLTSAEGTAGFNLKNDLGKTADLSMTRSGLASPYNNLLLMRNQDAVGDVMLAAGNSLSSSLMLKANGFVGIGTTGPISKLEIASGDVRITAPSGSGSSVRRGSFIIADGGSYTGYGAAIDSWATWADQGDLRFYTSYATTRTERMRIDGAGNVGIGTTSYDDQYRAVLQATAAGTPSSGLRVSLNQGANATTFSRHIGLTNEAFSVHYGTIGASSLSFGLQANGRPVEITTNAGHVLLTPSAGNNVGIGTTSPVEKLDVRGSHATVKNNGGTTISAESFDGSNYPRITVTRGGCGGTGLCNATNGQTMGQFDFSTKNQAQVGAIIRAIAAESQLDSAWGSNLQFLTVGTLTTTAVERMTILHNGSVGIGTTSPTGLLQLGSGDYGLKYHNGAAPNLLSGSTFAINTFDTDGSVDNDVLLRIGKSTSQLDHSSSSTYLQMSDGGNFSLSTLPNASYKLHINGDLNLVTGSVFRINGTQICSSAGCTAVSDARLKENVSPLSDSYSKIQLLDGVSYDWREPAIYGKGRQIGFIAQDLEKIYPEAVVEDEHSGLKTVAYDHLVAPLVEAFKSLVAKFNGLDARVEVLESENAALKKYVCDKDPSADFCGPTKTTRKPSSD